MSTFTQTLGLVRILALVSALVVVSCKKDEKPTIPEAPWSPGSADFSRYVAIGNSLTAGFQSNALSSRDQIYSYPNLLAQAIRTTDFQQPLIREPGVGARKRLVSLTGPVIVDEVGVNPLDPASNLNVALPRPYNNLGIPGAVVFDMLDRPTSFQAKSLARQNPFFALIQRDTALGRSVVEQARRLQPTFMTCWIGNNDVLGYATSGGSGSPTPATQFEALYAQLMDSLRAITPNVIVANIPDVTAIPFFTTIGPSVRASLPAGLYLRYQKGSNTGPSFDSTRFTESTPPLLLLTGSTYASLLGRGGGQGGGKYYRDNNIPLPPGIDTTKPFGFHPQNPWPGRLTLDADEQAIAAAAIASFNTTIRTLAEAKGFAVVDINGIFRKIVAEGLYVPGIGTFSTAFITGGLFSYDGVHPSSRGAAIVANEFLKVIVAKYNATIPPIDIASVPPMQGLGFEKVTVTLATEADLGSFDFLLNLLKR
jgi:lysophospholipase L1-like esterase